MKNFIPYTLYIQIIQHTTSAGTTEGVNEKMEKRT